jgi:hypothetical protein
LPLDSTNSNKTTCLLCSNKTILAHDPPSSKNQNHMVGQKHLNW